MGLYTKADYDLDMERLDKADQLLSRNIAAGTIRWPKTKQFQDSIEIQRRMCKGKLLGTMRILADGKGRGSCMEPGAHRQPCYCRRLVRHTLQGQAERETKSSD